MLLASLVKTRDPAQAGTLAWGIGNLKGLTADARVDITRDLLTAMHDQADHSLCQQYASTLRALAAAQPAGPPLHALVQLAQDARDLQGADSKLAPLLDALLADLRAREQAANK